MQKKGVNVLANKSELKIAMEKRSRHLIEVDRKYMDDENKSQFQRALEERAKRLDDLEKKEPDSCDDDSGHCSPEPENEFLKSTCPTQKIKTFLCNEIRSRMFLNSSFFHFHPA
ncbi:unnamed protein product [Lepeophtheirus salmonis]|uniref:(salmon louse) hypothetical protein n=1 Tax=Lepeophtheirus salmonis TaxID=72036 RepID=A0A7R8D088_LEPSM|nr:unnamed protein product [Lepeophtheirus salmonis]CAF2981983.1 unnamed protein product [Lepeophtheirus salmonis]